VVCALDGERSHAESSENQLYCPVSSAPPSMTSAMALIGAQTFDGDKSLARCKVTRNPSGSLSASAITVRSSVTMGLSVVSPANAERR